MEQAHEVQEPFIPGSAKGLTSNIEIESDASLCASTSMNAPELAKDNSGGSADDELPLDRPVDPPTPIELESLSGENMQDQEIQASLHTVHNAQNRSVEAEFTKTDAHSIRDEYFDDAHSEVSLCDFLSPRVVALNEDLRLQSTGSYLADEIVPAEDQNAESMSEAGSEPSLCDFLSPRVRALNADTLENLSAEPSHFQCNRVSAKMRTLGYDRFIEPSRGRSSSKGAISETSLCDFLPPRVIALNEDAVGSHRPLVPLSSRAVSAEGEDSRLGENSEPCLNDYLSPRLLSSGDHAETRSRCNERSLHGVGMSSEHSLCDFLPPRVLALNNIAMEGSTSLDQGADMQCSYEDASDGSEESLCDFLSPRARALNDEQHGANAQNAEARPHRDVNMHFGNSCRDGASRECLIQESSVSGSSTPVDENFGVTSSEPSEVSLCDFLSPRMRLFNDRRYENDRRNREAIFNSSGTQTAESLCDFLPPHVMALNGTNSGRRTDNTNSDGSFDDVPSDDGYSDALHAWQRSRQRSGSLGQQRLWSPNRGQQRTPLRRALSGVISRALRRCSSSRVMISRMEDPEDNDARMLHMPATLQLRSEPTLTMNVDTFRKEVVYPRQVRSRTTLQTFCCSDSEEDDEEDAESCAVCLEPFSSGDVLRKFPCAHRFHTVCIDPWLVENRLCPICRHDPLH